MTCPECGSRNVYQEGHGVSAMDPALTITYFECGDCMATWSKTHRDGRGFSLLEVIVAMSIAAMIATGTFALYAVPLRSMLLMQRFAQAQDVAARALQPLLAQPCEHIGQAPATRMVVDAGYAFQQTTSVAQVPGVSLWRFSAEVSWRFMGQERTARAVVFEALPTVQCEAGG